MITSQKDHPKIATGGYGIAKNTKKTRDCTTCEHEKGYSCAHELEGTKKHDKMVENELKCHSFRKYKRKKMKTIDVE
jgi:hypothetical protein